MIKRKIFILIILIIVFAGFVYGFFSGRQEQQVSTTPLPAPQIPENFDGNYQLTFEMKQSDFDFPNTLPVLSTKPSTISDEESRTLAKNLNLDFEPTLVPDVVDGLKHRYSGDNYVLIVSLEAGKINYVKNITPGEIINKQLSDNEIIRIAESFLVDNNLTSQENTQPISVEYFGSLSGAGLFKTEKEDASFYQVNFGSTISDVPTITTNPNKSPVLVRVLPDGSILSASVNKFDQVTESQQVYKLKDYDEVLNTKSSAILISLDEGNIYLPDLPPGIIESITINDVKLAYLVTSSLDLIIQPIFLLEGVADLKGVSENVNVTLYLPAISINP